MLRALTPTAANHAANEHGRFVTSAVHIAVFRDQIDELVAGQYREIGPDMRHNRIKSAEGRAKAKSRDAFFGDGRIEYAIIAELCRQVGCRAENGLMIIGALAQNEG